MTDLPSTLRHSELLNRLVLNRNTLEELGRVEVLWMYPPMHRVLGFVCKSGFLGRRKLAFKLSQVEAIGENGILTHSAPDETDSDRVRQLESLIQCEVWSQAGNKIGRIIDCEFNLQSGLITDYLLISDTGRASIASRLTAIAGTIYRLPPASIASFGSTRVLIVETSIQAFIPYREGISQTFSKVSTTIKEESAQVADELRSLRKRAQQTTLHTTDQLKTLAEQAKERAIMFAEQAKETAQTVAEQLQETSETLIEQLEDNSFSSETKTEKAASEDFDFDFDFDFDDDPPTRQASPANPNPSPSPKISDPAPQNVWDSGWDIDEEPWMHGDRASHSQDTFSEDASLLNNTWDIDEDPWNITELPEPTDITPLMPTEIISPAATTIDPTQTPESPIAESTPITSPTEAEELVQHLLDEINLQTPMDSDDQLDSDDQPWI
jgi:uncharacterized protein YrrD